MTSEKPKTITVTDAQISLCEGSPWAAFKIAAKKGGYGTFNRCISVRQIDGQITYAAMPKGREEYLVLPIELQSKIWAWVTNAEYTSAFGVPMGWMERGS